MKNKPWQQFSVYHVREEITSDHKDGDELHCSITCLTVAPLKDF